MNLFPYTLIRIRRNSRIVAAYRAARRQAHDLIPVTLAVGRAHPLRARTGNRFA
jgi:hypothetical protein